MEGDRPGAIVVGDRILHRLAYFEVGARKVVDVTDAQQRLEQYPHRTVRIVLQHAAPEAIGHVMGLQRASGVKGDPGTDGEGKDLGVGRDVPIGRQLWYQFRLLALVRKQRLVHLGNHLDACRAVSHMRIQRVY